MRYSMSSKRFRIVAKILVLRDGDFLFSPANLDILGVVNYNIVTKCGII